MADFEPTRLGLFHLCFLVEESLGRFLEGILNYIRPRPVESLEATTENAPQPTPAGKG